MAPSEEQLIRTIIRDEVQQAVAAAVKSHVCRFRISDDAALQIEHAVGVAEDLGGGSLASGIEAMRENHKWLAKMRTKSSMASSLFFTALVVAAVGGFVSLFWAGAKTHLLELLGK